MSNKNEAYPSPVVTRVEIDIYRSPRAPKAFTVTTDLFNFRESAELAEGPVCTGYAYRPQYFFGPTL